MFDTQKNELMNNVIAYVAPRKQDDDAQHEP